MLFLSLLGSLGDSLGEPSFMFPMDRTHDASACFFLIIICFLWIGAQFRGGSAGPVLREQTVLQGYLQGKGLQPTLAESFSPVATAHRSIPLSTGETGTRPKDG